MLKQKPRRKYTSRPRQNRLKRNMYLYGLLILIAVVVASGLYILSRRSEAAATYGIWMANYTTDNDPDGDGYRNVTLTVYAHVPTYNPVQLYVTLDDHYMTPSNPADFIPTTSFPACFDLSASSGQVNVAAGTVTFKVPKNATPDDSRRIQFSGTWSKNCYGSSPWILLTGTTNIPLLGGGAAPLPNTGDQNPGGTLPCTQNCGGGQDPGHGNGDSGDGSGSNGNGRGGGNSTGSSATKQNTQANPLPSSSSQGDSKPTTIEPSPFYDGKMYAAGSTTATPLTIATAGSQTLSSWPIVAVGAVTVSGMAAGAVYWYRQRKK